LEAIARIVIRTSRDVWHRNCLRSTGMSPQVEKIGANAERLIWRRLLFALFVLLVPFADCPVNSDPQLAGIFDNSDDFDDDFDEISLNHVGQAVANQAEPDDTPVAHHVGFRSEERRG